jgi:hypothetical protein
MTRRKPIKRLHAWTPDQLALLDQMAADGKSSWDEIGEACGHTGPSAQSTYCRRRHLAEAVGNAMPRKDGRKPWSQVEIAEMVHLRDVEKLTFWEIDARLGRKKGSSNSKYHMVDCATPLHGPAEAGANIKITPAQLADRDARKRLEHSSLTAAFCGDPLPGRSALDQRGGIYRDD